VHTRPLSLHLPSRTKLQCTLQLGGQINSPYFISTNICSLWRLCTHRPENHTPVRDLIRDGRLSTYDESVLKLSKVSFRGKCARTEHPLKLSSPTKLSRLGHFLQLYSIARPVFYCILYLFSAENNY
jgi:hypothetical protein